MWFVEFLKDFIGAPSILMGIFVLIGCLLQKKGFSQTITSTLKAIIGFIVLQSGATILTGTLTSFSTIFQDLFGLTGAIPINEATLGVLAKQAAAIVNVGSFIMIIAMVLNVFYAKFMRMKYIFLSGHCLFYMSVMLAGAAQATHILDINTVEGYAMALIIGGLMMSLYMVLQPAATQRWMRQITGTNEIALGHTGGLGYVIAGFTGEIINKIFKGKVKSTEHIKVPKSLAFFRNTTISIAIVMFIIYLAIFIPEGIRYEMGKISDTTDLGKSVIAIMSEKNWVITAIIGAFTFAASIEIILLGVRTFVAELVPAFKGISTKFIKNAKPAVDCPTTFPFAPNAVVIGFISALFGALATMGITIAISYKVNVGGEMIAYIILPSIMNVFFLGGTSGVFGNVKGGVLGAILGGFLTSFIAHFVPFIFLVGGWLPTAGIENPNALNSLGWGDPDYLIGGIIALFSLIGGRAGLYTLLGVLLVVVISLIVDGIINNKKVKKLAKIDATKKLAETPKLETKKEKVKKTKTKVKNQQVRKEKDE